MISTVFVAFNYFMNPVWSLKDKVNTVNTDYLLLRKDVDFIKENHLRHIEERITRMESVMEAFREVQIEHSTISKANNDKLDLLLKRRQ